jgi:hypothetical protein
VTCDCSELARCAVSAHVRDAPDTRLWAECESPWTATSLRDASSLTGDAMEARPMQRRGSRVLDPKMVVQCFCLHDRREFLKKGPKDRTRTACMYIHTLPKASSCWMNLVRALDARGSFKAGKPSIPKRTSNLTVIC